MIFWSQVDDFEQSVTIDFVTHYGWRETRIEFESKGLFGKRLESSRLRGDFVENCLWHPRFQVLEIKRSPSQLSNL